MTNIASDHKSKILILATEFLIADCFVDTTEGTQGGVSHVSRSLRMVMSSLFLNTLFLKFACNSGS